MESIPSGTATASSGADMVSRIFSAINWLMAVTLVRKNMLLALGITQRGFIM
jgi:hypothetical protein